MLYYEPFVALRGAKVSPAKLKVLRQTRFMYEWIESHGWLGNPWELKDDLQQIRELTELPSESQLPLRSPVKFNWFRPQAELGEFRG